MKWIPALLLNVVVAGGAILVYDQLRAPVPATTASDETSVDTPTDLEARLAALEAKGRPLLEARGAGAAVEDRLARLEQEMQALAERLGETPAIAPGKTPGSAPTKTFGVPTKEEIEHYRKIRDAANFDRVLKRSETRVDAVTKAREIRLSDQQREAVIEAHARFQARESDIWREAKQSGRAQGEPDWATIIPETDARVRREMRERLEQVVDAGTAEALATGLYPTRSK